MIMSDENKTEAKYTIKNLVEDNIIKYFGNAEKEGRLSIEPSYRGYVEESDEVSKNAIIVQIVEFDTEKMKQRNGCDPKTLRVYSWGIDNTITHITEYYPDKEMRNRFKMVDRISEDLEACRNIEEARKYGGWIKNPEDRKKSKAGHAYGEEM